METQNDNLSSALELAEKGYIPVSVLPCSKIPAEKWRRWMDETPTQESILQRWQGTRNGVAILCKGIVVIDVDDENRLDLALEKCGLKKAPICKTPSGGFHIHGRMRSNVERSRQVRIQGQPFDLLTGASPSILPPSIGENGRPYEWLTPGLPPMEELPLLKLAWTRERSRKRFRAAVSAAVETNRERLLYRARRYLERIEPAVSGRGGHNKTFATACKLARLVGYDAELLWTLLLEYSARCLPPWSEKELRHKWEDALRKRES